MPVSKALIQFEKFKALPRERHDAAVAALKGAHLTLKDSTVPTRINLNTASAAVIYAAVPELDLAAAQRLVGTRNQAYFKDTATALASVAPPGLTPDPGWTAVSSSFF